MVLGVKRIKVNVTFDEESLRKCEAQSGVLRIKAHTQSSLDLNGQSCTHVFDE